MTISKPQYKKLGEITKIQKGTSITKDKVVEGNIPVIAGGQNPAYYTNKANRNGPIITVSASGAYAGFVNFFDYPIFASDCTTIEPLNINDLDTRYLFLFLKSKQQEIYRLQRGAGQPHVYGSDLQNLKIPLPLLSTQRAIADKLDKLQSLIDLKKEAIAKTDDLAKSIFLEVFGNPMVNEKGWEMKKIGYVSKIIGGGTFKSSDYTKDGIKLVTIKNVHFDKLSWDEITYLPINITFDEKFNLKEDDIIMAMTRPIIKSLNNVKVVVVKRDDLPCLLNQRVCKFDVDDSLISKRFLLSFICTDYFKDKISSYCSTSLQPNVSSLDIANTDIPLPPLSLQQKFASIITEIEVQKSEHKLALAKLEDLYQAEMQKSFSL